MKPVLNCLLGIMRLLLGIFSLWCKSEGSHSLRQRTLRKKPNAKYIHNFMLEIPNTEIIIIESVKIHKFRCLSVLYHANYLSHGNMGDNGRKTKWQYGYQRRLKYQTYFRFQQQVLILIIPLIHCLIYSGNQNSSNYDIFLKCYKARKHRQYLNSNKNGTESTK